MTERHVMARQIVHEDDEAAAAYTRQHRYFPSPREERTMTRRLHALLNGSDDPDYSLSDPAGPFDVWIGQLDLEALLCELQSHPADALRRISLALNETTGNMTAGDPQNSSKVNFHQSFGEGIDSAFHMLELLRRPPMEPTSDTSSSDSISEQEYDWHSDEGPSSVCEGSDTSNSDTISEQEYDRDMKRIASW